MKNCDGCIACPVEVRGLYAVAYNLLNLYKGQDSDRIRAKLPERMQELQNAVDLLTPIVRKHFGEDEPKEKALLISPIPTGNLPNHEFSPDEGNPCICRLCHCHKDRH